MCSSSSSPLSPSGAEATMAACSFQQHLQSAPAWLLLPAAVGLLALIRLSLSLLRWVYVTFLRPGKNLRSYGSWAVVTGSTDGIGRAYALQFARKGLNLVLVGRNPDKLLEVSEAVRQKNPAVRVETVLIDFTGDLVEGVAGLLTVIRGLDVGILVNNAGISYPYARFFHEVDEELLRNLIKVNVEGTTRITQAVLPGMLERKRGAIVNMGTGAAIMLPSYPLYSVYAGTKAYIDQFSRCLYMEYKDKGIDVQCQMPLYVATKMTSIRKSSFIVSSPDGYARAALRWIGYEPRCTPYWPHSLMWFLFSLLPVSFLNQQCLSYSLNIRKKGQLKDVKKKEQ